MKITLPKRSSRAFTIVELLVVVSLIAILSGLILNVVNIKGIRSKSRDAQRAGDLKRMQTALEVIYADNRVYPSTGSGNGCTTTNNFVTLPTLSGTFLPYINPLPTDPLPVAGSYCGATYDYWYCSNGSIYKLTTNMEVASSVSTPNSCATIGTGCAAATCYAVKNP